MTSLTGQPTDAKTTPEKGRAKGAPIFDLSAIDLSARIHDAAYIQKYIPHRGDMFLLDAIAWESANLKQGVGVWNVTSDEFWVPGHFPAKPLVPGVLLIESGAQLACYLYNARYSVPKVVLFLRIEDAAFRASVEPGDTLYVLCNEIKAGRRTFRCEMQGRVGDRVAYDATITGMISDA